jgi:hypothetical protein
MERNWVPDVALAIRRGVRWLRENAEHLTETRDIAITISSLVAAERNPHSHLIERLSAGLLRRQALNGSWSEELWDTVWSAKALAATGLDQSSDPLRRALDFIDATRDPTGGTWYEEPFETMLVLDLVATIAPHKIATIGMPALRWIASLQRPDGCIVGIRYTGMAISLFSRAAESGIDCDQHVVESGLLYIRQQIEDRAIWTSASWSNYYPLSALLDFGLGCDDETVRRALEWFLLSQDADGKWMQVSKVHDTAMAVLVLSRLLTTPLIDITEPRIAALNIFKENGTIRISFHDDSTGAIAPAERMKISEGVREDLSRNQQLVASTLKRVRAAQPIFATEPRGLSVATELERNGRYAHGHLIPGRIQRMLDVSLADHLRFEIDERLKDLPWELIHDGTDFFCLRYAAGRLLMSDQEFHPPHRQARAAADSRVVVVADPLGDLPAARIEGRRIASLLRDRCGMNVDEFTSSGITKKDFLLSLKNYDIVHYAGHASHDTDRPDESCLLFSDGQIPAFEIARFLASGSPTLVFLNACWSAEELRDPDSYSPMMRGLGRTFLYAGVAAFIGYLIPVPDESATGFAISVYEGLAQGQTIGESLRQARILCRKSSTVDDLTWCSAVLYGDPAARAISTK